MVSSLVDGTGRTLEAQPPTGFRLRQTGVRWPMTTTFNVTAATTLAGKTYKGVLKRQ